MTSFAASHTPSVVVLSLLIAALTGHVAIAVASHIRLHTARAARLWVSGGALTIGSGIWAMDFVAMGAWEVPITVGYAVLPTFLSWLAGVVAAGVALAIASRDTLRPRGVLLGGLVVGTATSTSNFVGLSAVQVEPGLVWNGGLVAVTVLIAFVASCAVLQLFFMMCEVPERRRWMLHLAAAAAVGVGLSAMHYTGMAGVSLQPGAVCTSANALSATTTTAVAAAFAIALLLVVLASSVWDAKNRWTTRRLSDSLVEANVQLQAANDELQRQAFQDPLTGLPNRLVFEDRLAQAIRHRQRTAQGAGERTGARQQLAVCFIDLDGFKPVNDSLGHAAGDHVLRETAARLRRVARDSDTVARVGGDEFLMLLEKVSTLADAIEVARRALKAIAEPIEVAGQRVEISGSIGIVLHPDQGQPDKLVAQADSAMYVAKRSGGNNYAVFESAMDADALSRLTLQNDLRHAAERGEMQLHYQPKVDCSRGHIIGVEALLRWTHLVRGSIGPNEFIPIAERHGIMTKLGQWVIDEACRQIAVWSDEGLRMRVAINLSVHQLREADLVERIDAALRRHAVDATQLLCEITESVAMEDIRATQATFEGLGRIGVFLSIDDFGTGYSSLSYLRQLPARQLKIDRSFIDDLEGSSDARAVVDAVIRLAHALGLSVVTEGVETAGQRTILGHLGCDELQGYFFARPIPPARLIEWARGNRPDGSAAFAPSMMDAMV